jgi:hypothetical protein
MVKNFNLGQIKLTGASIKDPRVAMRAVIAVLLAANVAAAVIAFKPFGGRRRQAHGGQGREGAPRRR